MADYSKPVQEVFTRAAWFGIFGWQGWEALSLVGDRTCNKIPGLPSWVPDYTCELPWRPLQSSPCEFRTASTGLEAEFHFDKANISIIAPQYHHFDTVVGVLPALWSPDPDLGGEPGIVEACNFLLEPEPIIAQGDDDVLFVLARTLTADRTGVKTHFYDLQSSFEKLAYCQVWRALQSKSREVAHELLHDSQKPLLPHLPTIGISNGAPIAISLERVRVLCTSEDNILLGSEGRQKSTVAGVTSYLENVNTPLKVDWNNVAKGRSLFRTKRGHLGLGPRTTQVGDRVGILKGAQVPYLFRHLPQDPENILDLVGEAFVHGIMYGELQAEERLHFERITLY